MQVIFNIVATILSVMALLSSIYIALEHRGLQKRANFVPAYMKMIDEFRSVEFQDRLLYVTTRLRSDHDPHLGISGLPDEVRRAVFDVGYFYQGVGMLRLQNILDEAIVPTLHVRGTQVWEAIAPYVEREREIQGLDNRYMLRILEEYAKLPFEQQSESAMTKLLRRRFGHGGLRSLETLNHR